MLVWIVQLAFQSFLPSQPRPLCRNKLTHSRFAAPLFSWLYELLFSQPISFLEDLRCPLLFPLGLHSTFNSRPFTLANSFIYRFYAKSRAKSFVCRFYAFAPGVWGRSMPSRRNSAPSASLYPEPRGARYPFLSSLRQAAAMVNFIAGVLKSTR